MNSLSWLIYIAEVVQNLRGVFIATSVVSAGAIALVVVMYAIMATDGDIAPGSWKKPIKWVWIVFLFASISALTPSASTVYMIAASEAGEAIVTSPDGEEMLGDLKQIIRQKIKKELKEYD